MEVGEAVAAVTTVITNLGIGIKEVIHNRGPFLPELSYDRLVKTSTQ
jgi:hypothetical protein